MTDRETLTGAQQTAVSLLAQGWRRAEVERELGISRRTLDRWMVRAPFKETLDQERREIVREAMSRAKACMGQMLGVLQRIAEDDGMPPPSRVSAASKILDVAIKAIEVQDLDERIRALEAAQAGQTED